MTDGRRAKRLSPTTHWGKPLAYTIAPKSGPMRVMETLVDANRAITTDLPAGSLKQEIWRDIALLLVRAADTGDEEDIEHVSCELLNALIDLGWMNRAERKP